MTVKEIAKKANIPLDELLDQASKYYEAKIARPQYKAYLDNPKAQMILFEDCLKETLLSLLSTKGKLNLVYGGKNG